MPSRLKRFEAITRALARLPLPKPALELPPPHHPFEERNIHPGLPPRVRKLFDDGHYAEATYLACKYLDRTVETGYRIWGNPV